MGLARCSFSEGRPFPNWHALFQLIDDPLSCSEAFASVETRYLHKKGCFTNCDKTNSVMNYNELEVKSIGGLFGNSFQLVPSHFTMRLVIDSFNFAALLHWSDYAPEINNRASAADVPWLCRKRRLRHRNFTNDICHAFKLLVTVTDSTLSSYKRRYKNEHESM
jgi:hypothetical protein